LLRSMLAPVGHGLWTAILGGVLFSSSGREHFALTWRLLFSYLGVSVLHALWDSMHTIALVLTLLLTGTPYQYQLIERGYQPEPTPAQVNLFTVLSWGGLIVVSLIGIFWLLRVRNAADQEARTMWRVPVAAR
jgi:protease PrsW